MPKVTERLRTQWKNQLSQAREERLEDQHGRARSAEGVAEEDHEIRVMEYLLDLPLGATFNGVEVNLMLRDQG